MARHSAAGLVLIAVGLILLADRMQILRSDLTVLIIGASLLAGYAFTREYGLLVPGGILTGLGAGIAARTWLGPAGAPVLLGLGLGFLLVYGLDRASGAQRAGGSWPLIPGGILVVIGLIGAARGFGAARAVAAWWPVLLVALGIWLLLRPKVPG
jgi:hypothetical protein